MIVQRMRVGWLVLALLILVSCQNESSEDELSGRITLWHNWSEGEAIILDEALAEFQELHPDVSVIASTIPEDSILEEFADAGSDGLGPDLLIGLDSWIGELVGSGLIRPVFPFGAENAFFNARNRGLTEYEGLVYGVPLSLAPRALYYNQDMVEEPVGDLITLLEEADADNRLAFAPRFVEAYWGIQAFGEGLFDSQDRFTLAESGFTEWLTWLTEAQRSPGVILNVDDTSLLELFASQQIAYYVAGPDKQNELDALMSEEDPFEYGVVPLPDGPGGRSGPLLPAETILLYAHSSENQARIADALASFLVNQQQSIRFMRETDRVPANPAVSVDRRIYPITSGFSRQAQSAVFIPNEVSSDRLIEAGDRAYVSVLSGALSPSEAVCRFGREVAAFQGYSADEMSLPEGCELSEEVTP